MNGITESFTLYSVSSLTNGGAFSTTDVNMTKTFVLGTNVVQPTGDFSQEINITDNFTLKIPQP
jgi:hypothetical protein